MKQPLDHQLAASWKWISLWLFFLPAWWINQGRVNGRVLCCLAFLGFCVRSMTGLFAQLVLHGPVFITEQRIRGFFVPANALAMYALIVILGLLVLKMPREWQDRLWKKRALLLGRVFGLILALETLFVSQSRTGILALLVVLPVVLVGCALQGGRIKLPLLLTFMGVAMIIGLCQSGGLQERFVKESRTLRDLSSLSWHDIPYDSIGFRYHMFCFGLQKWKENKWFGYGPGTAVTREFAARMGLKELATRNDLHNGWLVVLVRLGLCGFFLLLAGGGVLLVRLLSWRRQSPDFFWFLAGSLAVMFICSQTNFRWTHADFRFIWLLLAGLVWQGPGGQEAAD